MSESKYRLYVYDSNTPFSEERNQYIELEKVKNNLAEILKNRFQKTIEEARNIEKIQEYISKKGSIDNLSEKEKELLEKIK